MCTTDGASAGFGSVAEALRIGGMVADYLNSPAAGGLDAAGLGEALVSLGEIQSRLAAMARLSKRDARAAVRQMRQFARHPHLADAQARGEISQSWAGEIAQWLRRLPEGLRAGTEKILAAAAAAGAPLEDLATITAHALAQWQAANPDPDDEGTSPTGS